MSVHLKKRTEVIRGGRKRAPRPKTFKTEEAAKKYAEANKIANYLLVNLKNKISKTKKLKIVQK